MEDTSPGRNTVDERLMTTYLVSTSAIKFVTAKYYGRLTAQY